MTFLELAKARYSVRAFKKDGIEDEKLNAIIEAGRVAPTACNNQPQRIYVVKSEEKRKKLAEVCRYTFDAPMILVVAYDKDRDWKNRLVSGYSSGETDAAIVCTHMMLEAWDMGIGSCWVGYFNADEVGSALSLPKNVRVTALLPIGYAADDAKPAALHSMYRDREDTVSIL
ncbi:MAG: nitroreductase family protein [Clostridia bacterium]|nr:nitroreductase family protein [Clostridia bacterium]